MRLWHYKLLPALPNFMIIQQWRACMKIAEKVYGGKRLNDPLVRRVMDYNGGHLLRYIIQVDYELCRRGMMTPKRNNEIMNLNQFIFNDICCEKDCPADSLMSLTYSIPLSELFTGWHDLKYLNICYMHLLEFKDCGVITEEEFAEIHKLYNEITKEYCCMDISSQETIDKAYAENIAEIRPIVNGDTDET